MKPINKNFTYRRGIVKRAPSGIPGQQGARSRCAQAVPIRPITFLPFGQFSFGEALKPLRQCQRLHRRKAIFLADGLLGELSSQEHFSFCSQHAFQAGGLNLGQSCDALPSDGKVHDARTGARPRVHGRLIAEDSIAAFSQNRSSPHEMDSPNADQRRTQTDLRLSVGTLVLLSNFVRRFGEGDGE